MIDAIDALADLVSSVDPSPSDFAQYGPVGLVAGLALGAVVVLYKTLNAAHGREQAILKAQIADRDQRLEEVEDRRVADLAAERDRTAEERRRADRLEAELSNLNTRIQSEVTTALGAAAKAVSDALLFVQAGGR